MVGKIEVLLFMFPFKSFWMLCIGKAAKARNKHYINYTNACWLVVLGLTAL